MIFNHDPNAIAKRMCLTIVLGPGGETSKVFLTFEALTYAGSL